MAKFIANSPINTKDPTIPVDVTAADEVPVARQQVDDGPGRLADAAGAQRVAKHPRMTCPDAAGDVGGNAVLPYAGSHARASCR